MDSLTVDSIAKRHYKKDTRFLYDLYTLSYDNHESLEHISILSKTPSLMTYNVEHTGFDKDVQNNANDDKLNQVGKLKCDSNVKAEYQPYYKREILRVCEIQGYRIYYQEVSK